MSVPMFIVQHSLVRLVSAQQTSTVRSGNLMEKPPPPERLDQLAGNA